ncbi:hypothetical protein ACRAWG_15915 [Methylobacterium sp. P31]
MDQTELVRKNAENTREAPRGRPFAAGNSGRPPGARNKASRALEAMLEGEAEEVTRTAITLAKSGDTVALRLCLERLLPPRKDRPVTFALPEINTPADLPRATTALLRAVSAGEITPIEATELGKLVDAHRHAVEVADIAERLARLEDAQAR